MILRKVSAFPRALALLAVCALAFGFLVTGGTPASAASLTTSGAITSADPSYRQINPGAFCNELAGQATHYDVVAMTVGANADSTLSISVKPTGFRAVVSVYQGAFLADDPKVNCAIQPKIGDDTGSTVSISMPLNAQPSGFPTQSYIVVITTDGPSSPGGAWSMTADSSATSIALQEAPPQPETASVTSIKRSDPTPTKASSAGFDVTFDKAVDGVSAANFKLTSGGTTGAGGSLAVTGSGATRHVTASSVVGDGTLRLDFINSDGVTPTVTNDLQGESYVIDHTAPTVNVPGDRSVDATGPNGATTTLSTVGATDAVDGDITASCTPTLSTFPLGDTVVTCTATDKAGNTGTAKYTVSVVDSAKPMITVPEDQTVEATGPDGASVTPGTATATDAVDGDITPTCDVVPDPLSIGEHTIHCTVADHAGNVATDSYKITVADSTKPTLTVPDDQTVEATGPDGASVTPGTATATDSVDGDITPTCDVVPDPLPIGEHTIHCTTADHAGNVATGSYKITVADSTKPTVTVPDDQTVEATRSHGATVTPGTVTATDIVDGDLTPDCTPIDDPLPLGEHVITCSVTDAAGNEGSADYTITVADTTKPTVTVPEDQTVEATGPDGASVTPGAATATDIVDGDIVPDCTPIDDPLPLGEHTITCAVVDGNGNEASASYTISVVDTTAPTVTAPEDQTVEATGPDGASVTPGAATATDIVDGDGLTPECTPITGPLPVGATTITCEATDAAGNKGSAEYTITVTDTTKPTLTLPEGVTATATGKDGVKVTFKATATDLVAGAVEVTCDPASGSLFPVGSTTVTCTASDAAAPAAEVAAREAPAAANEVTGTFEVTVLPEPVAPATTDPGSGEPTSGSSPASSDPAAGGSGGDSDGNGSSGLPVTGAAGAGILAAGALGLLVLGGVIVGMRRKQRH